VTNNLCENGYAFLIPGNDSFSLQTLTPNPITTYLPKALINSALLEPISAGSYRSCDDLEKENIALQDILHVTSEHDTACNIVLEKANAKLVVQGLHGGQLKRKLFTKENKNNKESTRAWHRKLMASKVGQYLTHPRFQLKRQKLNDEDDQGDVRKTIKRTICEVRKEKCVWWDSKQWERKHQCEEDISGWEGHRDNAKLAKQHLPPAKVPMKATIPNNISELKELEQEERDAQSSSDEDEDQ
jgi:hypothetical protein